MADFRYKWARTPHANINLTSKGTEFALNIPPHLIKHDPPDGGVWTITRTSKNRFVVQKRIY